MREAENKIGRGCALVLAALLASGPALAQAPTPSSPSVNPFSGLADLFKPRTPQDGASLAPQGASQQAAPVALPPGFSGKFEFKPMTARQLFEAQGMASTMALVQKISADAKAGKGGGFMDAMGALTLDTGSMLRLAMRMTASYLSYSALEGFMNTMSGNATLMDSVTVDVPQLAALGQPQLQDDMMGVARFLVAMKAANLMVAESEKSLDAAKLRYKDLLKDRETKALSLGKASMLVNGAFNLGGAESGAKALSAQDIDYLKGFYGKPLETALKDTLARELINRELQAQEPGEYTSILDGEKEVGQHYSAYSQTAVGTLSMLGFGSMFLNNVMDLSNQSDLHKLVLLPLARDGALEMVGLVKSVVAALARNDDLVQGTFSITANGKTTTGVGASRLLKSLTPEQLAGFRKAMIGSGATSYISVLDRQMPVSAADILDRVVERDAKATFARTALALENPDVFSFKSTFVAPPGAKAVKRVEAKSKQRLYEEDLEVSQDEDGKPYGDVQKIVRADVTKMSNQDLRRIMLAHKGAESLSIGDALVRLEQPGLQGLADRQEMTAAALAQARQDVQSKAKAPPDKAGSKSAAKEPGKAVAPPKKAAKKT